MGCYIAKLNDGERDWYLEWSTIVDAPLTYGMTRDEFKRYYLREHGQSAAADLRQRLRRADETGTSALFDRQSARELTRSNRAGRDQTSLSFEQILDYYCTNRPGPGEAERERPVGQRR